MNKLKAAFHDSCSSAQRKAVHPLGCPGPRGALFCSAAFNHLLKSQLHMKIAHCVCTSYQPHKYEASKAVESHPQSPLFSGFQMPELPTVQ